MADIIQTPGPVNTGGGGTRGGSSAGWAVAVIVLLAVITWLVFGGALHRTTTYRANVKITPPAGAPSGGSADTSAGRNGGNSGDSGSAGGSVAIPQSRRPY